MLPRFEEYTGKMWPDKIYLSCFAELNAAENVWKLKEAAHIIWWYAKEAPKTSTKSQFKLEENPVSL